MRVAAETALIITAILIAYRTGYRRGHHQGVVDGMHRLVRSIWRKPRSSTRRP